MSKPWPAEHDTCLAELMAAGYHAAAAAAEMNRRFGTDLTKDAVIGRAFRSGLKWKHSPGPRAAQEARKREQGKPKKAWRRPTIVEIAELADPKRVPRRQRRKIWNLDDRHCHFPFGDPVNKPRSFFFCGAAGADLAAGVPYCRCHCAIAYKRGLAVGFTDRGAGPDMRYRGARSSASPVRKA